MIEKLKEHPDDMEVGLQYDYFGTKDFWKIDKEDIETVHHGGKEKLILFTIME